MTNPFVEELFRKEACFLTPVSRKKILPDDPFHSVAVSSRIRLARNLKGRFFPARADDPSLLEIRETALRACRSAAKEMGFSPWECNIGELSLSDREFLLERHLISREFLSPRTGAALLADPQYGTFVMLNEEDHLRLQTLGAGMCLPELWKRLNTLDDLISARTEYAYDPSAGYLTTSPANAGTGMHASLILHLPGLAISSQMQAVKNGAEKLSCSIRGFYGEGSNPAGNFYQLSRQGVTGETEETVLASLEKIAGKVCEHEKKTRLYLLEHKKDFLLNYIGRSYALAKYSYILKWEDAVNSLSGILLGVNMGLFPSLRAKEIMTLLLLSGKAHLQKYKNTLLSGEELDIFRAELIRTRLQESSGKASSGRKNTKKKTM